MVKGHKWRKGPRLPPHPPAPPHTHTLKTTSDWFSFFFDSTMCKNTIKLGEFLVKDLWPPALAPSSVKNAAKIQENSTISRFLKFSWDQLAFF